MTSTTDQAAPPAGEDGEEAEGKSALGRALDVAGVVAACALAVIMFDVLSGGKVTRWVQRRLTRGAKEPCEGCDDTPAPTVTEAQAGDG